MRRHAGRLVVAQRAEELAQLGHRLAPGGFDREHRLLGLVRRRAQDLPCRPGLDDHHADRVREDVVQLARHVPALLGGRRSNAFVVFAKRLFHRLRSPRALEPPSAQDVAGQP